MERWTDGRWQSHIWAVLASRDIFSNKLDVLGDFTPLLHPEWRGWPKESIHSLKIQEICCQEMYSLKKLMSGNWIYRPVNIRFCNYYRCLPLRITISWYLNCVDFSLTGDGWLWSIEQILVARISGDGQYGIYGSQNGWSVATIWRLQPLSCAKTKCMQFPLYSGKQIGYVWKSVILGQVCLNITHDWVTWYLWGSTYSLVLESFNLMSGSIARMVGGFSMADSACFWGAGMSRSVSHGHYRGLG